MTPSKWVTYHKGCNVIWPALNVLLTALRHCFFMCTARELVLLVVGLDLGFFSHALKTSNLVCQTLNLP